VGGLNDRRAIGFTVAKIVARRAQICGVRQGKQKVWSWLKREADQRRVREPWEMLGGREVGGC
jgi:hypothetical protein